MRTEDVLAAIATGLWRWDNASGIVSLDAEAARLLGLPAEPVRLSEAAVRSRFHPVDWNEIDGVVNLAVAEGTLAEARLRIMDEHGRVLRTVRSRSKPLIEGNDYQLVGTLQEVAEQPPGTAARTPSPATGAAPGRPSCSTRGGRSPRRGRRPRCCGWRPRCRCPVSRPTGSPSSAWRATG
ncbi:PAS domain-containing protein [Streptomyces diastatochromogenes]|nr:PAS domain-containing protein [Streptomyces diastatochromogenes]